MPSSKVHLLICCLFVFLSVGGDGLVHEVLNGLMDRADREKAIKIPIGIIPTGW